MTETKIVMYIKQTISISVLRKRGMKGSALKIFNGKKILRKNSSSLISKSKSPIRRIVRVEETSNSPLKARGEHRKRVIIKGRNGTEEGVEQDT